MCVSVRGTSSLASAFFTGQGRAHKDGRHKKQHLGQARKENNTRLKKGKQRVAKGNEGQSANTKKQTRNRKKK